VDAESSPPASLGEVVAGKYRLDRVIGSGGMGTVFAATHLDLETSVAIKVLNRSAATNKGAVDRFAREARACARLRSENIVRVTDVGVLPSGVPYMVMEYLEGADLEELLRLNGPLPIEDAVDYVIQACAGLAEAHAAGVVHRDLKPANLYLTSDAGGVIKVVDFGIAKVARIGDNLTKTGDLMGSPLYMSPEQLASARDTDGRADVWALGVILHELITGTPPFDGETIPQVCAAVLVGKPQPITSKRPDVPEALVRVLDKCLEKKPDERYASVVDLANALAELAPERAAPTLQRIARLGGTPAVDRHIRSGAPAASVRPSTSARPEAAETGPPWSPDETRSLPPPITKRAWLFAAPVAVAVVAVVVLLFRRPLPFVAPRPPAPVTLAPAAAPPPPSEAPSPSAASAIAPIVLAPVVISRVDAGAAAVTEGPRAPVRPGTGGPGRRTRRPGSPPPAGSAPPSLESEIRAAFPMGATVPAPASSGE